MAKKKDKKAKKDTPQFGKKIDGHVYESRKSVYGIAFNDSGQILVARARGKVVLPGGGVEGGEGRKKALRREALEETGHPIEIIRKIGRANEYSISRRRRQANNKKATFYLVEAGEQVHPPTPPPPTPEWMDVAKAMPRFKSEFFRWAVEQVMETAS